MLVGTTMSRLDSVAGPFLMILGYFFGAGEGFCLKTCYNQHCAAFFDRVLYFATASRFRNTPAADARNFFVIAQSSPNRYCIVQNKIIPYNPHLIWPVFDTIRDIRDQPFNLASIGVSSVQ